MRELMIMYHKAKRFVQSFTSKIKQEKEGGFKE